MRRWMQDSVREVLAYLKTARELEIGLMKLDKLEKHSNWKILQLEGKAYPEFQPPNARIEQERADAKSKARAIGAVFGGIAGFVFEFVEEWRIVEASGSPLAWFGNLVVFGMAAATCAAIGAGIGALISWGVGAIVGVIRSNAKEAENKVAKEKWKAKVARARKADAEAVAEFRSSSLPICELRVLYERMLNEHYSDGPIYRKYQTLPAICQLYEYFDSGRFAKLADAYNQYELEVRLDRLNSEKALQVLCEIRDSQRLLYDALLDIRDSIDSVNKNIDKCFEALNGIAYSQEVSSICLQQTALATTLLSQIGFYKNRYELSLPFHMFEGALIGINARLLSQARRMK